MNWQIARLNIERLGKILSNFTFLGTIFAILPFVSFIFQIFYFLGLIIVVICTLGLIFLFYPEFSAWFNVVEVMAGTMEFLQKAIPYVTSINLGICVLSIILLCFGLKNKKSIWRIVMSSIFAIISLVLLLVGVAL